MSADETLASRPTTQTLPHPKGASVDGTSRESVEALLKKNYPGLRLLVLKSARNEAVAADILNDAIATTLEHLRDGRIERPDQLAGYVLRVAENLLRNHRRKMDERDDRRVAPETIENIASDTEDELELAEIAKQARAVLAELPTVRDRLLVKRFYLDQEDKEIICNDLNLSPLHFDKVIFRARQRMKALLEKRGYKHRDFFLMLCAA